MSIANPIIPVPHLRAGAAWDAAESALVLLHGRGSDARGIIELGVEIASESMAIIAPEAAGNTWYPYSFLMPLEQNEPSLSRALNTVDQVVGALVSAGFSRQQIALAGFSQGACLSLEYAARHAARFGGIVAFSGGLIGPEGTPRDYSGSFDGTPVFLGCSDVDAHIPKARVEESAAVFSRMGAVVDARLYPGMGHTVNNDEVAAAIALLAAIRP